MKKTILKIALVFVFLLCLVLNIVLLCTPVFRGTYSNDKMSMTFYENTYTNEYNLTKGFLFRTGFYYNYVDNQKDKNYIILTENQGKYYFIRKSVFCIEGETYTYTGEKLYCKPAIALQVIYPVVGVASIVSFVVIQLKDKKKA